MPLIQTITAPTYTADHRKAESPYIPVIFVHGAGGSRLDWSAQVRRLPQANAIVVDLPGHGKSPVPGRQSVQAYAADIIAGQSMGGAIAQTIGLDYADRAAGLILIGTGVKLRVHPDILGRILDNQNEVATLLKDWYWTPDTPDALRDATYQQIMAVPAQVIYDDYQACDRFDIRERLSTITTPVLVIGGTQDQMTPLKYSTYLQANLPNAQLVTIEGGGHMMALQYPDVVANAVRDWLNMNTQNTLGENAP